MSITREHLAVILFVVAIVGIAFGVLIALFLLFCDEQRGVRKPAKQFVFSNWK